MTPRDYEDFAAEMARVERDHYAALRQLREDGALLADEAPAREDIRMPDNPIDLYITSVELKPSPHGTNQSFYLIKAGMHTFATSANGSPEDVGTPRWMASLCERSIKTGQRVRIRYVGFPTHWSNPARLTGVELVK